MASKNDKENSSEHNNMYDVISLMVPLESPYPFHSDTRTVEFYFGISC